MSSNDVADDGAKKTSHAFSTAEYLDYFKRRGRALATLPPLSPPPPRTARQVAEIVDRMYWTQNHPLGQAIAHEEAKKREPKD